MSLRFLERDGKRILQEAVGQGYFLPSCVS